MRLVGAVAVVCCGVGAELGLALEVFEQRVEILAIEDQTGPLAHGHQARAPLGLEDAALDADVFHGLGVGQAALHAATPSWSKGLTMPVPASPITCR